MKNNKKKCMEDIMATIIATTIKALGAIGTIICIVLIVIGFIYKLDYITISNDPLYIKCACIGLLFMLNYIFWTILATYLCNKKKK